VPQPRPHQQPIKRLDDTMLIKNDIEAILDRSEKVLQGHKLPARLRRLRSYAVSNFRGGIGKSTLSFNLGFKLAKEQSCLLVDTCSQRNFSQNIFGDDLHDFPKTLYDALVTELTGGEPVDSQGIVFPVKTSCPSFRMVKFPTWMIPGSSRLFLFPSLLYSQLAQYAQLDPQFQVEASARTLLAIKKVIDRSAKFAKADKILIDTSPFFGGATHLMGSCGRADYPGPRGSTLDRGASPYARNADQPKARLS
jgi:hypothetical protein